MTKAITKTCRTCNDVKAVALFWKGNDQCKQCKRKSYAFARAERQLKEELMYEEKQEKQKKKKVQRIRHKKKHTKKMSDETRIYLKTYAKKNKDKVRAARRVWLKKNKDKVNAYHRNYVRERRIHDPVFRTRAALRTRMNGAVKAAGLHKKCDSTINLLGISPSGLNKWLESQFTEGMAWENRSEWHIDHRVPCTAFDLTVPEQQRICFWYKNLQPMWAKDNIQKSNTYDEEDKLALIQQYKNHLLIK